MDPVVIAGRTPILLVADHASNIVPDDIALDIDPALLDEHVAIDIGTDALTRRLAELLDASAVIAGVSRLVLDLNREPDAAGLIPESSDGRTIPGNSGLSLEVREARLRRFHIPYHDAITAMIERVQPRLLVAMHSFTPSLLTRPELTRPWPVGILYNEDERAARPMIAALRGQGMHVGDNEPYSGRELNYTMNRHAEGRGLPYINIEVRQDLLETAEDIEGWAQRLADAVSATAATLA
ncbi:N-formylglutamate amidohydrolase [Sphingoaurantiacus capsulatus]|uniref:N-formylglutamate amidohydrolase n=1 Tax=Sphingoaurantiacus capsulatus TaxID=1771310 RepID=A0ABV7XCF5_9SPHN